MARVKRGVTSHKRHKKLLSLAKGHRGGRSKLVKEAKQSVLHAGQYAYEGRKQRKRDMRKLWITQLNIALRTEGLTYSKFISDLKSKKILLDRKILAELAVNFPEDFKKLLTQIKSS